MRINRRSNLCVHARRRPNDGSGGVDFDEERLKKRFVGLVFGWDGQQYVVG